MIKIDFTTKPKEIAPEYVDYGCGYKCTKDKNGRYHSYNDLPAWIWPDGTKYWYKNGLKHRDNGLPAIIWSDGYKEYWENGKCTK